MPGTAVDFSRHVDGETRRRRPTRRATAGLVGPEGRLAGSRVGWKSRETEAEGLVGVRTGILRDRRAVKTRAD